MSLEDGDDAAITEAPELDDNGQLNDFTLVKVPEHLRFLYRHLLENGLLAGIECSDNNLFSIYSRDLLKQLPSGRGEWEDCVPQKVADEIIEHKFFGYRD